MRSKFAMRVAHSGLSSASPQSGANQWHSMRIESGPVGQNSRNGQPDGSIGVTRFGYRFQDGLFLVEMTVAVSTRRMPTVPGSTQSGRRFGVTISE
jgi:hypothetical protein